MPTIITPAKRATLFDPKTGKREAIDIGSSRERELFSSGYQLETPINKYSSQTPLPMQKGEREIMINKYTAGGYTPEEGTRRVDELFAGRPPYSEQQIGQQTPVVDVQSSWQKAMTDLLRQGQGKGLDTDLLAQRNALIRARFGAQTELTPEQLRVLSPTQQKSLRGETTTGLEEQLGGVEVALQARKAERTELRQVMEKSQERLDLLEREELKYQRELEKETREKETALDEPLSIEEAATLGVPYGTTRRQAAKRGIIPEIETEKSPTSYTEWQLAGAPGTYADWIQKKTGMPIPASLQEDKITMGVVTQMADEVLKLGEQLGWSGIGGLGVGSVSQWLAKNFGVGSVESQNLRNFIGNIQGTIAKLRGGTSFTPNEQKLLETYTPTINDSSIVIKSKVESLKQFVDMKKQMIDQTYGGGQTNDPLNLGFNIAPTAALNQSAKKIASAIKQVESGGDYTVRGGSGEFGAYQFMPSTWKSWAGKYLGNSNAPMTQSNQDKVAEMKIADLQRQGYNAREIALIWNGGEPKVKKGVNKYGIAYDSGAYANKVLKAIS